MKGFGFNKKKDEPSQAAGVSAVSAELSEQLTTAQAALSDMTAKLSDAVSQIATLQANYEVVQAALEQAKQEKEMLEAQAKDKELAARKAKIEASVGTDRAPALLEATKGLSDEQFDAIVGAVKVTAEVESKSPMFREVGVQGETDLSKVEQNPAESLEAKLKAKYQPK